MDCTLDLTIPPDDFDVDSVGAALARLAEIVPDDLCVRIHVTTDFDGAVRTAVVDDPDYAAAYRHERELGRAIAKTIGQEDGSVDLVVDASIFALDADSADAVRTFEHEGLHMVVERRGETMSDLRSRRRQSRETAAGTVSAITGVACEEYRVERAAWDLHPEARADSHLAGIQDLLTRFETSLRTASISYQRNHDVEAISRSVLEAFHAMCTSTAYVAAELDAAGGARSISVDEELGERLLGPSWQAAVAVLQRLPAADVPTERSLLDEAAVEIGEHFESWLRHLGFSLVDQEDGRLHFGVLNPEEWVSWTDLL